MQIPRFSPRYTDRVDLEWGPQHDFDKDGILKNNLFYRIRCDRRTPKQIKPKMTKYIEPVRQ